MSNQPLEHEEKSRPESKAERLEKRAEKTISADASLEDREGLKDRHLEAVAKEQKSRAMSPEEAATKAKRGEKVVGDATKALGFSLGIDNNNKKGDKDVLLPGRTPEEVKTLQEAEASSSKKELPFDPDELQGNATTQDKPSFDEQLKQIQQEAIKQGAPPELFSENEKVRFVPAGTALEIRGHKYELNQITAQGTDIAADANQRRDEREVVAQMMPPGIKRSEVVDGAKTLTGEVHGIANFAASTIGGIGDALRMADAAHREVNPVRAFLPNTDLEGTKKLHEMCEGLSTTSRVLLQYSTTLNSNSPLYGKDFDPEGRQLATKLAEQLPAKLKEEINQFGKLDKEVQATKATELMLNIATFAETGGFALTITGKKIGVLVKTGEELAGAGKLANESRLLSSISNEIQSFASKIRGLPQAEKLKDLVQFLDEKWPHLQNPLEPKALPVEGPVLESPNKSNSAQDNVLQMGKHFDDAKPRRGSDKASEAKEAKENRKTNEALQLKQILSEGWDSKDEARAVKYLRDKGETITKNKLEHKEGYGRQTDGLEWELKNMSNVKERSDIADGILAHAKDGSGKLTEGSHLGRVLIDAREQSYMTEALALKGMRNAFRSAPKLKEIRIVGKDFDISLKPGQTKVKRW